MFLNRPFSNPKPVVLFSNTFTKMKKTPAIFFGICILLSFQNCSRHLKSNSTPAAFTDLTESHKQYKYIKNYFILSEQRKIEEWYSTYLNECTQFYKIENPTKDSIMNLIKSYWATSDEQKHDIQLMQWRRFKNGSEVHVTMNYSYRIIAENRVKEIPMLKLRMILNRQNKVVSIKELSRGQ